MPKTFTHIIKCNICGVQTGSLVLDEKYFDKNTTTQESLGIADSRCDADIALHGTFKELMEKFPNYRKPDDGSGDEASYNSGFNEAIDELSKIILDEIGKV